MATLRSIYSTSRNEAEQLYLTEDSTYQQSAYWLVDRGHVVAPRTLKRRFKGPEHHMTKGCWNTHRSQNDSDLFHTTIAHTPAAEGTAVSIRQVQQARLTNTWCRRDKQPQQEEQR